MKMLQENSNEESWEEGHHYWDNLLFTCYLLLIELILFLLLISSIFLYYLFDACKIYGRFTYKIIYMILLYLEKNFYLIINFFYESLCLRERPFSEIIYKDLIKY